MDGQDLSHLLHIVQTHHGEYGDPKPQTVEAWAVHMADNTSAILHEVASDIEDTIPGEGRFGPNVKAPVFRYPELSGKRHTSSSASDAGKNDSQMRLGV